MPAPRCGTPPVFCKSKSPIRQCLNCNTSTCESCLEKGGCYHCRDEQSESLTFAFVWNRYRYRLSCENGTPAHTMWITGNLLDKSNNAKRLSARISLSVRCSHIRSCNADCSMICSANTNFLSFFLQLIYFHHDTTFKHLIPRAGQHAWRTTSCC